MRNFMRKCMRNVFNKSLQSLGVTNTDCRMFMNGMFSLSILLDNSFPNLKRDFKDTRIKWVWFFFPSLHCPTLLTEKQLNQRDDFNQYHVIIAPRYQFPNILIKKWKNVLKPNAFCFQLTLKNSFSFEFFIYKIFRYYILVYALKIHCQTYQVFKGETVVELNILKLCLISRNTKWSILELYYKSHNVTYMFIYLIIFIS